MLKLYDVIINAIDEKLGEDIISIDFSEYSSFFDCVVIASVLNARMARSIIEEVEVKVRELGGHIRAIEGNQQSHWQIIDCYDVVVHLFVGDERQHYQLEKLWQDLPQVEVSV